MSAVTAIMQARYGSTRLPGKILLKVDGKTYLEHAYNRLIRSSHVDHVVIATTVEPQDDVVADFCKNKNWSHVRGSEDDVLDRYYQAALAFPCDMVVRVTSDCPLLDAELVDQAIAILSANRDSLHYVSNTLEPRTYPRGLDVEAFTFAALKESWEKASDMSDREHVTPYMYKNINLFNTYAMSAENDNSAQRWTLDTIDDERLLSLILHAMPDPQPWRKVLSLVKQNPDWVEINKHIQQKKL